MTKRYRPSNGTEGDGFRCRFCFECERDRAFMDGESDEGCEILLRTLLFDVGDAEYPIEWTYDEIGQPVCTAFLPLGSQHPTDRMLEEAGQLRLIGSGSTGQVKPSTLEKP